MPATLSTYDALLTSTAAIITALNLSGTTPAPTVAVRKLPVQSETIDQLPLICIPPSEDPEELELFSFENEIDVVYHVDIVIIAPGNRDFVTNLDQYLAWRQQIRRCFQDNIAINAYLAGQGITANIWKAETYPLTPLDRSQINILYDYSGLSVGFYSLEQRDN